MIVMNSFHQDVLKSIEVLSDRIVADDFKVGSQYVKKIISVTKLSFFDDIQEKEGNKIITRRARFHFKDCGAKPFVPCKTILNFIYEVWGRPENEDSYNGRLLEIFCDPTVKVGKEVKGGVRLSGMSGITEKINQKRKSGRSTMVISVSPISPAVTLTPKQLDNVRDALIEAVAVIADIAGITTMLESERLNKLKALSEPRYDEVVAALTAKQNELKESTDAE